MDLIDIKPKEFKWRSDSELKFKANANDNYDGKVIIIYNLVRIRNVPFVELLLQSSTQETDEEITMIWIRAEDTRH